MDDKQKTIAGECIIKGVGLHTGNIATLTLKPADVDTGIVFIRKDLNNLKIEAVVENVTEVKRGTTITKDGESISTIEHLMAALFACQIDNVIIEIDANELPVLDGSANIFTKKIKEKGITIQDKDRLYFNIKAPVTFEKGNTRYIAIPSDSFKVSCVIEYDHPLLKTQYNSFEITEDIFIKELSLARTFCFDYEIEILREHGLAKGGSLDNAIVIGEKKIHTDVLKYKDEFVRHKIMDLIGDMFLIGGRIKGHIIAIKCGHAANVEFTKLLKTKISKTKSVLKTMEIADIKKYIPHRYPFLFVDRVEILEEAKLATGYKYVTSNEYFFKNDKDEISHVPNVAIVEALAQTACVLFLSWPQVAENKIAYFMGINYMKFYENVYPGEVLKLSIEVTRARIKGGKVKGIAYSGDKLMAEAEFMFALVDK